MSSRNVSLPPPVPEPPDEVRHLLAAVCDLLIPEGFGMPSASSVGVPGRRLDLLLRHCPELLDGLCRAAELVRGRTPAQALALLRQHPDTEQTVLLTVAGAYYTHDDVRRRLGYRGQVPVPVRSDVLPDYVEEGLLDRVLERGPVHRDPDAG